MKDEEINFNFRTYSNTMFFSSTMEEKKYAYTKKIMKKLLKFMRI